MMLRVIVSAKYIKGMYYIHVSYYESRIDSGEHSDKERALSRTRLYTKFFKYHLMHYSQPPARFHAPSQSPSDSNVALVHHPSQKVDQFPQVSCQWAIIDISGLSHLTAKGVQYSHPDT